MIKLTQTIRRQFTDELFECVWPFCGIGAYRVNYIYKHQFHAWQSLFKTCKKHVDEGFWAIKITRFPLLYGQKTKVVNKTKYN